MIVRVVKKCEKLTVVIRAWVNKVVSLFQTLQCASFIWGMESGVSARDSAAPSLAKASLSSEPRHFSWDEIPENDG